MPRTHVFPLIFIISLFSLSGSAAASLKNGDLLFTSMPCALCPLIEKTTSSRFSHVSIVSLDENGNPMVIMAAEPSVMRVSLDFLLHHARGAPEFMRMRGPDGQHLAERASEIAAGYIGTPFDPDFTLGDDRLYCAELIYYSFARANGGAPVFQLSPMRFAPFAEAWTRMLGHAPPEGLPGISPGALERSGLLEEVAE